MSSRPIPRPIPRPVLLITLVFLTLGPLLAGDALADWSTRGRFSINTEGGPLVTRTILPSTTVEISDQDVSIGGDGENGTAAYSVSILDAAISASTSAVNALHALPSNYYTANGSVFETSFYDDLRFTIPAGSYPSGVSVVARVYVNGSVGASVGAVASYGYGFQFGESVNVNTVAPAPTLSQEIHLTQEFYAPGTTLSSPVERLLRFIGSVESTSAAPGEIAQTASSDISGRVICIEVPAGVTWVSDSGVFGAPDCADIAVPSLSRWAIAALVLGLAGSAAWMVARSRPEVA
jgi:hypothetical protein